MLLVLKRDCGPHPILQHKIHFSRFFSSSYSSTGTSTTRYCFIVGMRKLGQTTWFGTYFGRRQY